MHERSEMLLTLFQRGRLLFDCLPFLFMLASLIFTVTILDDITGAPPPRGLPLFLGFVTLVTLWTTIQRLRDLFSGVTRVQEDRLQRSWRSRGSHTVGRFYGKFEQLGTMRLRPKTFVHSSPGARYRVTYSPASKIVWSLEKLRYGG